MSSRTVVLGGILLLVALTPFGVWAATRAGDKPQATQQGLILERYSNPQTFQPEIVAYLPDRDLNDPKAVPSKRVRLECFDAGGKTVLVSLEKWPLTTDLGGALPHAHRPVQSNVIDKIRSCSMAGGKIRYAGSRFR
jgi:hypothetical protein